MAEPITITLQAGTVLLIGERLFALFIAPKMRTKEETQARAGNTSGEKDPAYWQREFRQAIDEKLDQRVIPILEKQTSILESQARTMEGLAVAVDVIRKRRR